MTQPTSAPTLRLSLLDALDHLLNRGVMLTGEATLSLAGVDLVYLGLNVLITSVTTLEAARPAAERRPQAGGLLPTTTSQPPATREAASPTTAAANPTATANMWGDVVSAGMNTAEAMTDDGQQRLVHQGSFPSPAAGERPEQGLARLVLTLVDLLRQLMERQALRRVESEALAPDQVERLGRALMELEAAMAELRAVFGLSEEDLTIDLGPLAELS